MHMCFPLIVAPVAADVQLIDATPTYNRANDHKTLECRIPYSKPRANVTWLISESTTTPSTFVTIDATLPGDFQSSVVVVVCPAVAIAISIVDCCCAFRMYSMNRHTQEMCQTEYPLNTNKYSKYLM